MKKSIISVFLFLFVFFSGNVIADTIPVHVGSSSFSASGEYDVFGYDDSWVRCIHMTDSYGFSGTTPQSGDISLVDDNSVALARAQSSAGPFSVSVRTGTTYGYINGLQSGPGNSAGAGASLDVTFRPVNDFNNLNLLYWYDVTVWAGGEASLIDLTENAVIWSTVFDGWHYPIGGNGVIPIGHNFESGHLYSMHLSAFSAAEGGDGYYVKIAFPDLQGVPEPATLLLLGLGLVGLAGMKRKIRK